MTRLIDMDKDQLVEFIQQNVTAREIADQFHTRELLDALERCGHNLTEDLEDY